MIKSGYDTIRYDSLYLTCSKKLTSSQLSPRVVFVGGGGSRGFSQSLVFIFHPAVLKCTIPTSQPGKLNSPLLVYSRMTDS